MSTSRAQRYLLIHEYVGTGFAGWQRQKAARTVQGTIEEALTKFMGGTSVLTTGSSRTDTGVHGLGNSCHVDLIRTSKHANKEILPHAPETVERALNHFLNTMGGDVRITRCIKIPMEIHARHAARGRTYFYRMVVGGDSLSCFEQNRAWHLKSESCLDVAAMQRGADHLVGHHDFRSFQANGCTATSPIRTLDELSVRCIDSSIGQWDPWQQYSDSRTQLLQRIVIVARSRSFLYHQVRLMVGALKAVGAGDMDPVQLKNILEAKDISAFHAVKGNKMAPPDGLYLAKVDYDDDALSLGSADIIENPL